uniref:subtilisin n=1 Tax=Chromera velia CCMP2878 TaxID=1169474 RepID=A0A0G4HV05_9ALVE|eukprot:Cvel_8734.t1-p1 / transcript=Cvel_8734.t1 / gene=Cvel_8734 / organism=Chromera_velia_CCMP2878 / gene_product=Thermitase, putative / transcript_product=Thermitase, putative / location=Cvel_scaffold488:61856-64154(-) / protein_length=646 / sequence_SO=supercontig / SO=protein_coding / is_pseudo=false
MLLLSTIVVLLASGCVASVQPSDAKASEAAKLSATNRAKSRLLISWKPESPDRRLHEEDMQHLSEIGATPVRSLRNILTGLRGQKRELATALEDPNADIVRKVNEVVHLKQVDMDVVEMTDEESKETLLAALREDNDVEFVEEDSVVSLDPLVQNRAENETTPEPEEQHSLRNYTEAFWRTMVNDPLFGEQWYLDQPSDADVDAPEAWARWSAFLDGSDAPEILVGIVDTGVDFSHPDLRDAMWRNEAELFGEPGFDDDMNGVVDDVYGVDMSVYPFRGIAAGSIGDDNSHGTHCAGIAAATHNNSEGIAGIAPPNVVRIVALKFLDFFGFGTTADAIASFDYGLSNGVKIFSNSWGMFGSLPNALRHAVDRGRQRGALFIMAAGNDGRDIEFGLRIPASLSLEFPNAITVAATKRDGEIAEWSNFAETAVDIAAPGEKILSTVPGATYVEYSGTSMATPAVAGTAALLYSYGEVLAGRLGVSPVTPEEIKKALTHGAQMTPELKGKVKAGAALNVPGAMSALRGILTDRAYAENGFNPESHRCSELEASFHDGLGADCAFYGFDSAVRCDFASLFKNFKGESAATSCCACGTKPESRERETGETGGEISIPTEVLSESAEGRTSDPAPPVPSGRKLRGGRQAGSK